MTDQAPSSLSGPKDRQPAGSLTQRTLTGFLWTFSGAGAQIVLRIGVLAILARLLTPADFGIVGAALIVVAFTEIFSQLGVGQAIVQRSDLTDRHIRTAMTFSACLGIGMGALIFALSDQIAALFRIDGVQPVIAVLALAFPIKGVSLVAEALLQRWMQFKKLAAITVASYVFGYAAIAISLASTGWGVKALVYGHLAQISLMAAGHLFYTPQRLGFALDFPALRQLLNFGGGLSLARIGNYIALNADNFIVARWLGADALGIYGRAYQFLMQPTNLLGSTVDRVLFPAMSSVQSDERRLAHAYTLTVALTAMTSLPLSAVLVVLAPELVRLLLGNQWTDVTLPFQILATCLVFRAGYKANALVARAKGAVYRNAWRQWVYAVLVSAGAWIGHFMGLNGVALGVAAAIAIQFAIMLEFGRRLTDVAFGDLILIYLRHLTVALLVGSAVLAAKTGLRSYLVSDIEILLVGLFAAAFMLGVIAFCAPRLFGDEGQWAIFRFKERLAMLEGRPAQ
ncbi:MAG: lipopolysaccharide biosynthesis protein [Hyphomicrobiales bacterium]|nr:lipopolysaccharide biosynthesis protein [Hyphomicrobiales bacterium]